MIESTNEQPVAVVPVGRRLEIGQRVGAYELVGFLGAGAMGEVYLAEDRRLGRKAAIKVVRPSAGGATAAQLLAEAQAMARLSHRNTVTVYEVGEVPELPELGHQVYLAMELIDGQTLRAWLAERPRSWRAVVDVFLQAGRGLGAAHAAGLVHRDVKPDNVLVGRDGRVCVSDFGLAGAGDEAAGDAAGTPAYMSPEQHRGERVDARSDQFAFCVALFEALHGARPFAGSSPAELRRNVLAGAPIAGPGKTSRVPTWLRSVVLRGLQPDPDARFPSMAALLERLGDDPAVRRRRIALGLALLATGGLVAFALAPSRPDPGLGCDGGVARVAGVWNPAVRSAVQGALLATGRPYAAATAERVVAALDDYTAAWSRMRRQACEATQVRHEQSPALLDLRMQCLDGRLGRLAALALLLARQPDVRVLDRALPATAALEGLGGCADAVALTAVRPPPDDPAVRARIAALRPRLDRAVALLGAGLAKDALPIARSLAEEAVAVGDDAFAGEVLSYAAQLARSASDFAYAEELDQQALQAAARARDDARAAGVLGHLVFVLGSDEKRFREALALAPAAKAAVARAGDPPRLHADVESALAAAYRSAGRLGDAEGAYEGALALLDKDPDPQRAAAVLGSLGSCLEQDDKLDAAADALRRAQAATIALVGPEHPNAAVVEYKLGGLLERQGKLPEALAAQQHALGICERALGAEHANCGKVHNAIGSIYWRSGRHAEAAAALQRAVAIKEKALGPDHPDVASSLGNLSSVYLAQQRLGEARAVAERALAILEKSYGPEHPAVALALSNLGEVLAAQHQLAQARALETRALAIREKTMGPKTEDVADTLWALANIADAEGRHEEALAAQRRVLAAIRETIFAPGHAGIAAAQAGIAEELMELRRDAEALPLLEPALVVLERAGNAGSTLARTRFLLAQALWSTRGDRSRARTLARAARSELVAEGPNGRMVLAQVDAWLARH